MIKIKDLVASVTPVKAKGYQATRLITLTPALFGGDKKLTAAFAEVGVEADSVKALCAALQKACFPKADPFPTKDHLQQIKVAMQAAATGECTPEEFKITYEATNWAVSEIYADPEFAALLDAPVEGQEISVEQILDLIEMEITPAKPAIEEVAGKVAEVLGAPAPVVTKPKITLPVPPTAKVEPPVEQQAAPVAEATEPAAESNLPAAQASVERGVALNDAALDAIATNIRQRMTDLQADEVSLATIEQQLAAIRSRANVARGAIMNDLQGFLQLAQGATTAAEVVEAAKAEA